MNVRVEIQHKYVYRFAWSRLKQYADMQTLSWNKNNLNYSLFYVTALVSIRAQMMNRFVYEI